MHSSRWNLSTPLETRTHRSVPAATPEPDAACGSASTPGEGGEGEEGGEGGGEGEPQRHQDPSPSARALVGTSLGGAKIAWSLQAGRGLVGRDHSWCRLPGTLPTHTPDTHGVWGTREPCGRVGGAEWLPLAPDAPSKRLCPTRRPRVLNGTSYSLGAGLPPCTFYRSPAATCLHLAAGSSLLWDLSFLGASPGRYRGSGRGCPGCRMRPKTPLKLHPLNCHSPGGHRDNWGYFWVCFTWASGLY